jgi:hypothetical protein
MSAFTGINCTYRPGSELYLPCLTRATFEALRPTDSQVTRRTVTKDSRGFTTEHRYVDTVRWAAFPAPPGVDQRPNYFDPAYGGQFSGTYTKRIERPAATNLVRAGYYKTVNGPTITKSAVRYVKVTKVLNTAVATYTEYKAIRDGDSLARVRSVFGSNGRLVTDSTLLGKQYRWRTTAGGYVYVWFGGYGSPAGANTRGWIG